MKATYRVLISALAVASATFAVGCKVTVVDGGGGSATTSTTKATTTTTTKASTGTGTTTTATGTTTTATGTTATGTSTGTSGSCDNTGTCGNGSSGCSQCAIDGPCSSQYAACTGDPDCVAFANCLGMCAQGDTACEDACVMAHQTGSDEYNTFASCVICDACPMDCDAAGSGCM